MFWPNLKSVASPVPEIIPIGLLGFGVGFRTPNLEEEEAVGVGDVTIRKSVGEFLTSYRPSIVTFSLSLRVSEILSLLSSISTPLFPHLTSSLPKISPCFPGSGWMAFGLRRAKMLG